MDLDFVVCEIKENRLVIDIEFAQHVHKAKAKMKKRLTFRNLDVVVKRLPLLDKTNKLEMEKCEKRVKSTTQKKGHKVLKVSDNVPYLGVENVCSNQNAYTENTKVPNNSKVVYTDNSFRLRNRIRMKPKCCGCNCTESDNTKQNNSKSISIITNVDENKSTSESVVSKTKDTLCHDPKSNLQCIVILERININNRLLQLKWVMIKPWIFLKVVPIPKSKIKYLQRKKDTENKNVQNESQKKTSRVIWQDKILDKITLTPPLKFLRKQTKPNYAEITLDITKENTSSDTKQNCPATKVPIYRQHIEEKKGKIPDNLYDFDESDSNGHIKKG
ncbi:hypothetical protein NQ317_009853 [Molorchus minor]|uniref:Uncharacterized protein n=1 Tax=Molorchus minor TaxID=1323400 RepID=A0ABQ9K1Z2_9CUCU|nr:hypothetical protein NQ317_009853 [Molorchus minor]